MALHIARIIGSSMVWECCTSKPALWSRRIYPAWRQMRKSAVRWWVALDTESCAYIGSGQYWTTAYVTRRCTPIACMTQCRILGKLRYTWGPNFKVVLLMILVCQVHYYNIGSTLHKYECREMDIWLDICDIWFYKKGPLKSSKMLQLAWNFFWLDKIKIYCHLSFTNFSVRQVLNWFFLRYLPYWYLQGSCCKIVKINQICVKFVLRGNYKILLTPLLL